MRIQGREAVLQAYVSRVSGSRAGQAGGPAAIAGQEDSITLSQPAQEVRKVREFLSGLPEVREDRVAELRARIARGDYYVSDEELADRILESGALDLPVDFLI
jgi:negative regulator of flagellin synthesis FlgM